MIRNKDIFYSEKDFRYAYNKYRELVEAFSSGPARRPANDPVMFAYKSPDTALRPDLEVGRLVQARLRTSSSSGDKGRVVYGIVSGYGWSGCAEQTHYDKVKVNTTTGEVTFSVPMDGAKPSTYDPELLEIGQIKVADVPQELVELMKPNFANCPLKNEGACMKGE